MKWITDFWMQKEIWYQWLFRWTYMVILGPLIKSLLLPDSAAAGLIKYLMLRHPIMIAFSGALAFHVSQQPVETVQVGPSGFMR